MNYKKIFLAFILFTSSFVITSIYLNHSAQVEEYNILEVNDNSVIIEAEMSKEYPTRFVNFEGEHRMDYEILTNDKKSHTIRYMIKEDKDKSMKFHFVNERSVYIHDYQIKTGYEYNILEYNINFGGDIQYSSINMSNEVSREYESMYENKEGFILYEKETAKVSFTDKNRTNNLIYPSDLTLNTNGIINTYKQTSRKFDNKQNTTIYIVNDPDTLSKGFVPQRMIKDEVIVIENRNNPFEVEKTVSHEVIHINQEFKTSDDLDWFIEGSAEYSSSLVYSNNNFFQKLDTEFNENWYNSDIGKYDSVNKIMLSEPNTWDQYPQYNRGEHVVYLIDISLRHHTDNEITIFDIMNDMNKKDKVTYEEFRDNIVKHTDEEFGNRLDSYVGKRDKIRIQEEKYAITDGENVNI